MTQVYPDDCFQSVIGQWWIEDDVKDVRRGRLIKAFVPHVDQVPCALNPIGRTDDREHKLADCEIIPVDISKTFERSVLPVAGLLCHDGEIRTVYRAKKRPMLLLALAGQPVPHSFTVGRPGYQTSATHLAAPYYGGNADGKRAGFDPEFMKLMRRCEFAHLGELTPISSEMSEEEQLAIIQREFDRLYDPRHPVRNGLETLDSVEVVRTIREALKR